MTVSESGLEVGGSDTSGRSRESEGDHNGRGRERDVTSVSLKTSCVDLDKRGNESRNAPMGVLFQVRGTGP